MEKLNMIPKKMSNTKLKLSDLNPHLMCVLCGGYYIDATTIVECLHSFCRSCIVKHLESSKYCPICEVQVHKTKPLINIRPDKTLQDIVYKLVPGLFASEMRNRRKFYKERPHYIKPNDSESAGEASGDRKIYVNDENITFSLVYHSGPAPTPLEGSFSEISLPQQNERRYFKCPTGVNIYHLKKLIKAKYDLSETNYKVEMYFKDQVLREDFTLLDISYIYLWKTKGSLDLTYKIFENVVKRQKIEEVNNEQQVIETPEVTAQMDLVLETTKEMEKLKEEKKQESQEEVEKEKEEQKEKEKQNGEETKTEVKKSEPELKIGDTKAESEKVTNEVKSEPKENGLTGSERKEVQLQISESGVMSVSQVEDGEIVRTMEETGTNKQSQNQVVAGVESRKGNGEVAKQPPEPINRTPERKPTPKPVKPYKTIRYSPKAWHPVIPKEKLRPTLMKNSDEPKKPLKFFKMRNMPRFLGNPSSGVKPMYAETVENNVEEKKKPEEKKPDTAKTLNKILKIDPKTLRPIEKEEIKVTPNTPNLLTNPFIPNNNHFLFSDLHLLPPSPGTFSNAKSEPKPEKPHMGGFKTSPTPNGTYPPICFPTPEHPPGFYPFNKPPNFPFGVGDKIDPLLRATRLSPFGNLAGFNVAGFHASLPPSISRLLNPHHHFRKINQSFQEKKNKEESTNETSKSCDDSLNVGKTKEESKDGRKEGSRGSGEDEKKKKEQQQTESKTETEKKKEEVDRDKERDREKEKVKEKEKEEMNGETSESASKPQNKNELKNIEEKEKDKNKDKDKDR